MSISDKQLVANQANAQKSTGPRTPEGKRKSSQNALKHGVLAKAILIEGECEQGFFNLCKAYEWEYKPQTPTEHALVNKAVTAQWRALRAASLEAAAITREMQLQAQSTQNEDEVTRAMLAVKVLNETSAHMERLSLYEHRFDLQHRNAIRDLCRLRQARRSNVSVARVSEEPKTNLNKPTHFNDATKELIAPTPISKPILDVPEAA